MMTKSRLALVVAGLTLLAGTAYLSPRGQAFSGHLAENLRCCQLPVARAFADAPAVSFALVMIAFAFPGADYASSIGVK